MRVICRRSVNKVAVGQYQAAAAGFAGSLQLMSKMQALLKDDESRLVYCAACNSDNLQSARRNGNVPGVLIAVRTVS